MSNTRWLPTKELAARMGKTPRTLVNWTNERPLGFPAPARINGRKFWREDDIVAWERSLIASKISEAV